MDSRSLLPLLTSEKGGSIDPTPTRPFSVASGISLRRAPETCPTLRAIRTRDFLYIRNFKPDRWPFGDPFGISANLQQTAKISEDYDLLANAPFRDMDASLTKSWLIAHSNEEAGGKFYQLAFASARRKSCTTFAATRNN